jgi:hypothetical protein
MTKKILFALIGVSFFMSAGLAQASLFHEIYFLSDTTFTVDSFSLDGPTLQTAEPEIAAIGTLTLDETAENGGFSCGVNCADFATLEIEVFQQEPGVIATANNLQPPASMTYTAEILMIGFAQVTPDWALFLENLEFTVAQAGLFESSSIFLTPGNGGIPIGYNTNGDMPIIPSSGECFPNGINSFCGQLNFGAPVQLVSIPVHDVPEPTTLALLSFGLAGLGFTRRRMNA